MLQVITMLVYFGALGLLVSGLLGKRDVKFFSPRVPSKTYVTLPESSSTSIMQSSSNGTSIELATWFVKKQLGFIKSDYVIKKNYTSDHNQITHIYLRQIIDNKEVFNGDININMDRVGKVLSYGNSFYNNSLRGSAAASSKTPLLDTGSVSDAINGLLKHLGVIATSAAPLTYQSSSAIGEYSVSNVPTAVENVKASQGWMQLSDGSLESVFNIRMRTSNDYYNAHVSTRTNKPVSLMSFVAHASYNVIPFGINDPAEGGRVLVKDPQNLLASPLGWHNFGNDQITHDTGGNNVYAVTKETEIEYEDDNTEKDEQAFRDPSLRVKGDKSMVFDFPFDETAHPKTYLEAATTNLFYYCNKLHDLYYLYGFDEKSGNFQESNFGKGGEEKDAVLAKVQEASGLNGAAFIALPDGYHGELIMQIYNQTVPMRDSDFDSGIIIHEYTHGLSSRLTGGAANPACLRTPDAGGLGEGWGDFIALMIRMKPDTPNNASFGMGKYATGKDTFRQYLYSTSREVNPLTFDVLNQFEYRLSIHKTGEVWAVILYEVYWCLIEILPATENWFEEAKNPAAYGNTLLLQLLIDGMKLQPCYPDFITARDAILQAEKIYTNSKYHCALWKGFSKRGLGANAVLDYYNEDDEYYKSSFDVPPACQ